MKTKYMKSYVPRHLRLGVCCEVPEIEGFHEVVETIPVVDDNGDMISSQKFIKSVPAADDMAKYRCSAFRLSARVKAGVPLEMVNINSSDIVTIDKLYNICQSAEVAENYVKQVQAQIDERRSWFVENDVSVESLKTE